MVRLGGVFFLASVILVLSGCGSVAPASRDNFYRLVIAPELKPLHSKPLHGILVVNRFSADGVIGQRPVAYASIDNPQTLYQYHYHFWADVPTRMLQEYAVDYLRQSVVASRVVTPELGLIADYQLRGKIRRLEFLPGQKPAVAATLQLTLIRNSDQSIVVFKTYQLQRPANGSDWVSASAAMNVLIAEIFKRFTIDIVKR